MHNVRGGKGNLDKRVEKTKRSIRNALVSLMQSKELSHITVKELSEVAMINRKTFYTHYADIYEIYDEIETELISDLLAIIKQYQVGKRDFHTYDLFKHLNDFINSDLEFYRKLMGSYGTDGFANKIKCALKKALMEMVREQVKMGEVQLSMCSEYIASGIMGMYLEWFRSDQPVSIEELARMASILSIGGSSRYLITGNIEYKRRDK